MQKARNFIPQPAGRTDAKPTTARTQPRPLDSAAQRLVGGGTTASTPVKGW